MIGSDRNSAPDPLASVSLPRLMARGVGSAATIGLVDGPVMSTHPGLVGARLEFTSQGTPPIDAASHHATSVAGTLVGRRGSGAPAVCPGAALLVSPVFGAGPSHHGRAVPPGILASAIVELADAGARILNLSLALTPRSHDVGNALRKALDHVANRGVIVVAAAGDHGTVGGTVITGHPSTVPVAACDPYGRPTPSSNLGPTIGRRGVGAPGTGIRSLGADGGLRPFGGTSAATALVTGTIALLWSEFPDAAPAEVARAVARPGARRASVVPPLLNAWTAYEALRASRRR